MATDRLLACRRASERRGVSRHVGMFGSQLPSGCYAFGAGATWTIPATYEGRPTTGRARRCTLGIHVTCGTRGPVDTARRAGPREHGRQAARSKRDRPERAAKENNKLSHDRRRRRRP
jgi:hypothetical protein